jgi:hypothetical protein
MADQEPITIRAHWLDVIARCDEHQRKTRRITAIREHAVAALDLLDNAEVEEYGLSPRYRLVLDPAPRGDAA